MRGGLNIQSVLSRVDSGRVAFIFNLTMLSFMMRAISLEEDLLRLTRRRRSPEEIFL